MSRFLGSGLLAYLLLAACASRASAPHVILARLTPDSGPIGAHVIVSGSGFAAQNNAVKFGPDTDWHHPDGTPANVIAIVPSVDGATIAFDVPSSIVSGIVCDSSNHCIGIAAARLQPGPRAVSIGNANGASNSLVFTVTAAATPPTPAIKVSTPTPTATSYRVVGKNILDANGQPFVPYGVELPSLWVANWRHNRGMQQNLNELEQPALYEIARRIWHANTLDLKIASANLFDQSPYDATFLQAMDQVVAQAHARGMNILLVLQYESTTRQPLPSQDSVNFWNILAQHYRDAPWVWFDVFNEPRDPRGDGDDAAWSLWQNGGMVNGTTYVGMQTLVNAIRGSGADNLILVDGLAAGEDLNGALSHRLDGDNIAYAAHPYFGAQHQTPDQWDHWFGHAASSGNFPVVADEWGEDQSATHGECVVTAPALVPQFLEYLKAKSIGLIAYGFYPGILIRGSDYATPTAFDESPYTCPATPFPNFDPHAQGAGQLPMNYFAANSR